MEKFFVSRPIFALSLAIVIVIVGLISILNLPIEQYPDITPPVVEVSATYDGADAETVNNAVATPVAQSVMGVSDMLYLQTTSANDGSMVMQVTFDMAPTPTWTPSSRRTTSLRPPHSSRRRSPSRASPRARP